MPTIANDIPEEIWRNIAANILHGSAARLPRNLISVNRAFFNYVLDLTYGEVRWSKLDSKMMMQLERLQNPIIGAHVRRLYVRAWFVDYLLTKRDPIVWNPASTKRLSNRVSQLLCFFPFISKSTRAPVMEPEGGFLPRKLFLTKSPQEIIKLMVSSIRCMTNVTEYNFELRDLPLTKDTRLFLTSARQAFGTSLRKLVLRSEIPKFKEILEIADFDNLDELDLHLNYCVEGPDKLATAQLEARQLLDTIVPFINGRRLTLRSLCISSSSTTDLSPFFSDLGYFPSLRQFSARICFGEQQLSDPSGLLKLLQSHKTSLLDVELVPNTPDHIFQSKENSAKLRGESWSRIHHLLLKGPDVLSSLESLTIPFVKLGNTLPLLHRSSNYLTRLRLVHKFLDLDEVKSVTQVFSHRSFELKHLHLEVIQLTSELLRILDHGMPGLRSLVLVYAMVDFAMFKIEMQNLSFSDWALNDIEIFEGRFVDLRDADEDSRQWYSSTSYAIDTDLKNTIEKSMRRQSSSGAQQVPR